MSLKTTVVVAAATVALLHHCKRDARLWAKSVEKVVRQYVMRTGDDVYVITGPVFSQGHTADDGMKRVWVPDTLFKLVYDPSQAKA